MGSVVRKTDRGLNSPRRGLFLLTSLGRELLELPAEEAVARIHQLDREYRRNRKAQTGPVDDPVPESNDPAGDEPITRDDGSVDEVLSWREVIWKRLHQFTPEAFEEFVLYVLREYGMELERVGGVGDEGIDGIGTARITPILSSRVAVQIKRYNPDGRPVGREVVALLQRDAAFVGAERAVLVTLGRFSEPARKAAIATTPTVELIDGLQLTDLMLEKQISVRLQPVVDTGWFDRYEHGK